MSAITRLMRKRMRDLNLRQISVRVFNDEYVVAEGFPDWQEAQNIVLRTITQDEIDANKWAEKVSECAERPVVSAKGASVEEALLELHRAADVPQ